ncbi:MAG: 50S ribosomal protein L15 [Waddliaceae bacterium]
MMQLHQLSDTTSKRKARKRVGRGIGSGLGKTSGRGEKGAGARSGYKRRDGYEGGQFRLFMKLPTRGFTRGRFQKRYDWINLGQIDKLYSDGETVNEETLRQHGFISGKSEGIKILGNGELTKSVKIEVDALSKMAQEKLQKQKISITLINATNRKRQDSQ